MTKDKALELALDWYDSGSEVREEFQEMIESILAQPEERKAGCTLCGHCAATGERITAQRKPLTEDEIYELVRTMANGYKTTNWLCRAIEASHNIKE